MGELTKLRERQETERFQRLARDDRTSAASDVDAKALASRLQERLQGEVRFDQGSRALYATDGSNYRQVPIGVVLPFDADDVVATHELARKFGAPILCRGGGTSLAGQCCNVAVVMDFSKYMNKVLEIDATHRLARVQPGCILDNLRNAAEKEGLTFGPDPATHNHCTIGGMLGNNSCGVHSLLCRREGIGLRTSDNTHELELLTYQGQRLRVGPTPLDKLDEILRGNGPQSALYERLIALRDRYEGEIRRRFPELPRRVSGYNLDELLPEHDFHVARALVGTEGTCATLLEATLHLVPSPAFRSLLVLGYPDIYRAGDHVPQILEHDPTGLEGIDHRLFDYVKKKGEPSKKEDLQLLPEGGGWLLVEFGGDSKRDADDQAKELMERLKAGDNPPSMKLFNETKAEERIWEVREGALGATAWVPGLPDMWPGFEDSAVPPERVGDYLRDLRGLMEKYDHHPSLYGHLGQGCIHCRISFDLYTSEGLDKYRAFMDDACDLVMKHGGSMSGEHGDGQARGRFLKRMFGDELTEAFREFKRIWDPDWKMNPGKVIDAYDITENLRIGPDYSPPQVETHFQYPADEHTFSRAVLRCVGVGKCRREEGGVMCPSYRATHDEQHSTRGRARLLWEMMNGEVLTDGWKSEPVKDALDLCLACKGCKNDCPVSVDMATYKAEFLSHYYKGRMRPREAYAFGYIHTWSRLAGLVPGLSNFLTHAPGLQRIAKWMANVAPEREVPRYAPQSFKAWFTHHSPKHPDGPRVILWPDTFNNWFHPETLKAAVVILEHAGWRVEVPQRDMCCGRPLYDYGLLEAARKRLVDVLDGMRAQIQADTPLVVLEPSCAAVFRDELRGMMSQNKNAQRLQSNTFVLSEFIQNRIPDQSWPELNRRAHFHGHCHQKAVMGMDHEEELFKRLGLEIEVPEPGCCGMAGSFGFEKKHYDVSRTCGELALAPALRESGDDALIIADGFSCREQIRQLTGRKALHAAEVMEMAIDGRDVNAHYS